MHSSSTHDNNVYAICFPQETLYILSIRVCCGEGYLDYFEAVSLPLSDMPPIQGIYRPNQI